MKAKRRLIGIVRFYDEGKGFGFIDTNGYGIDDQTSMVKSKWVELFFCYKDMIPGAFIFEGDWVSFIYESAPEKKRGHARYVRALTYTIDGLRTILNYRGDYTNIYFKKEGYDVNVIADYTKNYLSELTNSKQEAFDLLLSAHTSHIVDLTQHARGELMSLFLAPSKYSITINDLDGYRNFIADLAVAEFQEAVQHAKIYNGAYADGIWTNFSRCLSIVDDQGLSAIRNRIELCDESYRILDDRNLMVPLIDSLSSDSCKGFFSVNDTHLTPAFRLYIYQKHKDSSILLHHSMLEYWKHKIDSGDNPFSLFSLTMYITSHSDGKIVISKEVSDYIANSHFSSDQLRLWTFIETSNILCFNHIEDKSLFNTWLPKQSDYFLYRFFEHNKDVPERIITDLYSTLGASRVAQIASKYGNSVLRGIPVSMIIRINVGLELRNEVERTESSGYYGGYWTWGEGMKNEKYDVYTYKDRLYLAVISVDYEHYTLVKEFYFKRENNVREQIRACLEKKMSDAYFAFRHGEDETLVYLTIEKAPNDSFIPLLQESIDAHIIFSIEVVET